ncbi:MAG: hypothetical protein OXE94_08500 [Aestuariivita sp.]|nr:hypothetical protein [Aestuariivita sp.]MCY4203429.1 hypothetical protein [Aestuariivita sp.]
MSSREAGKELDVLAVAFRDVFKEIRGHKLEFCEKPKTEEANKKPPFMLVIC